MEASAQSRWIAKTLGEFGHELIVANPWQVQLISANHKKTIILTMRSFSPGWLALMKVKSNSQDFKAK